MKSYKIRLELNDKQATLAKQHAGTARFAYNWGLAKCRDGFRNKAEGEKYKHPTSIDLHKMFVAEVKSENPWTYEISKCAPQQALRNLEASFKRFFIKKSSFPSFKKKGQGGSFYLEGAIRASGNKIKLPKFGWLKCSEVLPDIEIKNVVVSCQAEHWFVSFKSAETPTKIPDIEQMSVVGVDLGIKTLATLSTGITFENRKPFRQLKHKLKLRQRQVSKKFRKGQRQSANYKKAQQTVANLHYRIACIRKDSIHKLTTYLAKNHSEVVIEDLNVSGMSKNHRLASAILDGGFYETRRQLEYKTDWYGSRLTIVDRFFPSSKTCSNCGFVNKNLKLKDRTFDCPGCQASLDRDLNAAINLKNKAVSYTVSLACGAVEQVSGLPENIALKQEANSNIKYCASFA